MSSRLPTPAVSVAALAALFGRDVMFLTVTYMFAVFSLAGLARLAELTGIMNLTLDATFRVLTIAAFSIGLAAQYLLTGKTIINPPRGLSLTVAILAVTAIWSVLAFTDVTPIIQLLYVKTLQFWQHIVETYFGDLASGLVLFLAIYMLILPRIAKWILNMKLSMPASGFVASLATLVMTETALYITTAAEQYIRQTMSLEMWAIFAIIIGLAAFFEIRRALLENPPEILMQLPALFLIASWALPYLGQSYVTWLTFMAYAFHMIALIGILIGLAGNNKRAYIIGTILLTALGATYFTIT